MVKAVTYILENAAGVQALLGTNAAGTKRKVYPVVVPSSETAPYIAVRLVGKATLAKGCGYLYTIQVTSYENSYDEVTALNDAVIAALDAQASGTVNGVAFAHLNFESESDEFEKTHNLYAKITTFTGIAD